MLEIEIAATQVQQVYRGELAQAKAEEAAGVVVSASSSEESAGEEEGGEGAGGGGGVGCAATPWKQQRSYLEKSYSAAKTKESPEAGAAAPRSCGAGGTTGMSIPPLKLGVVAAPSAASLGGDRPPLTLTLTPTLTLTLTLTL